MKCLLFFAEKNRVSNKCTYKNDGSLLLPLSRFYGSILGEDVVIMISLFLVARLNIMLPTPAFLLFDGSHTTQIMFFLIKLIACMVVFFLTQFFSSLLFHMRIKKEPWNRTIHREFPKKGRPDYLHCLSYSWSDKQYCVLPDKDGVGYAVAEARWWHFLVYSFPTVFCALWLVNHFPVGAGRIIEWLIILAIPIISRFICFLLPKEWYYASGTGQTVLKE